MARVTVPMYGDEYEDPGVPHEVVELNPPHNAVLEIADDDAPMSIEDLIMSVSRGVEAVRPAAP